MWRERAAESEESRCLPSSTISDLHNTGLLKILAPKRFGGLELGWPSLVEASRLAARECASTGWAISLVGGHVAIIGRMSYECQDAIFSEGPNQLISTASAPTSGQIDKVPGGAILNGTWRFSSCIDHADWIIVPGPFRNADDVSPTGQNFIVVPASSAGVIDTWDVVGMRATGSKDISFDSLFVADQWIFSKSQCLGARPLGAEVNKYSYLYQVPFLPYCTSWIIGPILGCAEGALKEYVRSLRSRRTLSHGFPLEAVQADRLAESASEIACAELLYESICVRLHSAGLDRQEISADDFCLIKRDRAYLAQLCVRAIGRIVHQLGASSSQNQNPIQRHWRDLQVMASHVDISRDKAFSSYCSALLS